MRSTQRQSLHSTWRDFSKKAEKELQTYRVIDKQLYELMKRQRVGQSAMRFNSYIIVPNHESIKARKEQLKRLENQISHLKNVAVETMTEAEFEQFINS